MVAGGRAVGKAAAPLEAGLRRGRSLRPWLLSAAVFAALAAVTGAVWQQQVDHQRSLLTALTEDVCVQAARRLEVFVKSHLRVASIFARRWSTHEERDFSRQRFDDFAAVLIDELPGYYAIGLVAPGRERVWVQPPEVPLAEVVLDPDRLELLQRARRERRPLLSGPFASSQGATAVYALVPLLRQGEFLGTLVVDIYTQTLVDDCFHSRIRSKYHFRLRTGGADLFRSDPAATAATFDASPIRAEQRVDVGGRFWQLTMAPRPEKLAAFGREASLPIPLLGLFLSLGLSVLVFMLLRRVEAVQAVRDQQARLARKVLLAQEEERARISRELHDELGQLLTAQRLELGWLQQRLAAADGASQGGFDNAVELLEQATGELRRMCRGLRPPLLDDLGLAPAVRNLVEEVRGRTGLAIDLRLELDEAIALAPEAALCAYRVIQEALHNTARHAGAEAVQVVLSADSQSLHIEVADDGAGFDPDRLGELQGFGLEGMRERAHLVGGRLALHTRRGAGTRIVLDIPLAGVSGDREALRS